MNAFIFGILGAVAAALYWRYFVFHGTLLPVLWITPDRAILLYAAGGFVVGWVVGFALDMIGHN